MNLLQDSGLDMPWMAAAQAALSRAIETDRLGHALLLQVPRGVGDLWLAHWLAARLFCSAEALRPCGACLDCRRAMFDEHPDCSLIQPLGDSREIRIDQIREIVAALTLTSHGGARKLAILSPADSLNRNSANALLKTLEEPTFGTLLVLVAAEPGRLPATVLSRCTRIRVAAPDRALCRDWLQRHGAAGVDWDLMLDALGDRPLDALEADPVAVPARAAEVREALCSACERTLDPVATAERWSRDDPAARLACTENWLTERLREAAASADGSVELRAGTHLPARRMMLNIPALFATLDLAREARRQLEGPVNKSLVLERLLWQLQAASVRVRESDRQQVARPE